MDKIDVYFESATAVLQTKNIGHMAALRAAGSIIALAEVEHGKFLAAQQAVAVDPPSAPEGQVENINPAGN